jgi:two-component system torCAD operon response regulator TorR
MDGGRGRSRTYRVLLVEDEELTQNLLKAFLEKEGLEVAVAGSGDEMFDQLDHSRVDLLFLDLGLPDEDGLALLRQIRSVSSLPIIVVTSRTRQPDRLAALELGADDYLSKPFDPQELVLRARNLLGRSAAGAASSIVGRGEQIIEFRNWRLNMDARSLTDPLGEDVTLTRGEFDILAALAKSPDRVLSRAQLLDATAHLGNEPSDRTVDVLVSRLRRKISRCEIDADLIVTVPGFGYKLRTRG